MSKTAEYTPSVTPNILILPDGNRRWAVRNGASYAEAYEAGARRIVECARHLGALGMHEAWYGMARPFNFERSGQELTAVLDACLKIHGIGQENGEPFNITIGGDPNLMPLEYQQEFKHQESAHNPNGVTAHLLIGWSSTTEATSFAQRVRDFPNESPEEQLLRSSAVSKPIDFLIRTGIDTPYGQGGRLSGMLPLHSLEAELHFESTLFPDFTKVHLDSALTDYATRTHRNMLQL